MRGRKPKPISRQIAEGDPRQRGKHKLEEREAKQVKAARGFPPCPRHLHGRARAAWNFWVKELSEMKLDCRPDAMMLEGACVNYARAVQSDIILRYGCQVSEPILDSNGEVVGEKIRNHPAVAVSNACWRNVRAFCSEFGLSPVSRTRLPIDKSKEDDEDDLMKLLSAPRERKHPRTIDN